MACEIKANFMWLVRLKLEAESPCQVAGENKAHEQKLNVEWPLSYTDTNRTFQLAQAILARVSLFCLNTKECCTSDLMQPRTVWFSHV